MVEWHQPDRVLRQFGLQQPIPRPPIQTEELHSIVLRNNIGTNWVQFHSRYIEIWHNRERNVVDGTPSDAQLHYHSEYMEWFRRVTRRWISHQGAAVAAAADGLEHISLSTSTHSPQQIASSSLAALREDRRSFMMPPPQPAPAPSCLSDELRANVPLDQPSRRRRRRQQEVPVRPTSSPCLPVPEPIYFHSLQPFQFPSSSSDPGPSTSRSQPFLDLNSYVPGPSAPTFPTGPSFTPGLSSSTAFEPWTFSNHNQWLRPEATPVHCTAQPSHFMYSETPQTRQDSSFSSIFTQTQAHESQFGGSFSGPFFSNVQQTFVHSYGHTPNVPRRMDIDNSTNSDTISTPTSDDDDGDDDADQAQNTRLMDMSSGRIRNRRQLGLRSRIIRNDPFTPGS